MNNERILESMYYIEKVKVETGRGKANQTIDACFLFTVKKINLMLFSKRNKMKISIRCNDLN